MVENPADKFRGEVGAEGPGGVDISKAGKKIGYVRDGETFVGPGFGEFYRFPVDGKLHFTEDDKIEACGGDDDIGLQGIS